MPVINESATLRDLEFGPGTGFEIDEPGIDGLGVPPTKTTETQLDGRDGSYAGPEFLDVRDITIPIIIAGVDQDDAMNGLALVNAAWQPANDGVDLVLALTLPGWGDVTVTGRPRGVTADVTAVGDGIILALCQFRALQPAFVSA